MTKRLFALVLLVGCSSYGNLDETTYQVDLSGCDYPQIHGNATHAGKACPEQTNLRVVAQVLQDDGAEAHAEQRTFLQIHHGPPLTSGDFAVVPSRTGFVSVDNRHPEGYHIQTLRWDRGVMADGAKLVPAWTAKTTWQPVDSIIGSDDFVTTGYTAQFGPAIANGSVYVPSRHGQLQRLALTTGAQQATINPFAGGAFAEFGTDERTIVNNALSVDALGNVYYTIVAWPLGSPDNAFGEQPRGSWLVQVRPDDSTRLVDFKTIASASVGVAQERDACEYRFGTGGGSQRANGPTDNPPVFGCGQQRPALNAAVAIDEDLNRLIVYSYSNNAQSYAYLIEVDRTTMQPIVAHDTRGKMLHGCGNEFPQRLPIRQFFGCPETTGNGTTNIGFHPAFNRPVPFRGEDLMDSSPVIAPNGDRVICGYTGGFVFGGFFDGRGGCVGFRPDGSHFTNERFGWEVTPTVWQRGPRISYLHDLNEWSNFEIKIGQSDSSMQLEFAHEIDEAPSFAFDFLDANIAFGSGGDRYAVNGDGHVYKFRDNQIEPVEVVPLLKADGTLNTIETLSNLWARDRKGRLHLIYGGYYYVLESDGQVVPSTQRLPLSDEAVARLRAGARAKAQGAELARDPGPARIEAP